MTDQERAAAIAAGIERDGGIRVFRSGDPIDETVVDTLIAGLHVLAAGPAVAITDEMVEALRWYADERNWQTLPDADGDPECAVPHAVPCTNEDGALCCDCGDRARKALTAALAVARPAVEAREIVARAIMPAVDNDDLQARATADRAISVLASAGLLREPVTISTNFAGDRADTLAEEILGSHCACYAEAWPAHSCQNERDAVAAKIRAAGLLREPIVAGQDLGNGLVAVPEFVIDALETIVTGPPLMSEIDSPEAHLEWAVAIARDALVVGKDTL